MRCERLLKDKAQSQEPPRPSLSQPPSPWAFAQIVCLLACLLATAALWTLAQAPAGLQQLLLLCLARLAALLCIATASYRALARRRAARSAPASPGTAAAVPCLAAHSRRSSAACSGSSGHSVATSPRTSLAQAALYLQAAWLIAELALGSTLLGFYPYILDTEPAAGSSGAAPGAGPLSSTVALLSFLPLACAAAMSGCFLFLQRLANRRRRQCAASPAASLECGLGQPLAAGLGRHGGKACGGGASHLQVACRSCTCGAGTGACALHPVDVVCSPLSDSGSSFSSCSSSGGYCSYYARTSSCGGASCASSGQLSLSLTSSSSCGGAPSPTGHVRSESEGAAAQHQAAIQAACEIVLMEHQLDTKEYCLFVHKRLRPIRTRPSDKTRPAPPGLLRDLITNSFTFQHEPDLAAQLAASMRASAGGASADATSSGASSITFQAAAAAASGVEVM